jgi:predicted SprT family Zn-dependent metalloprotease
MGYVPALEWRSYRVSAGMAYYPSRKIGLSRLVLKDPDSVRETLGHEYAHLLAVARLGQKGVGHGIAWKNAMKDLGLAPIVRHNFQVERNNRSQRVDYVCLRCGITISRNRRLPHQRRYVHVKCGGDLKFLRVFKVIQTSSSP